MANVSISHEGSSVQRCVCVSHRAKMVVFSKKKRGFRPPLTDVVVNVSRTLRCERSLSAEGLLFFKG